MNHGTWPSNTVKHVAYIRLTRGTKSESCAYSAPNEYTMLLGDYFLEFYRNLNSLAYQTCCGEELRSSRSAN